MPQDKDVKDCPFCGEKVEENAEKCPLCGRIFRLDFSPQKMSADRKRIGYIIIGIAILISVVFIILFILPENKKGSAGLSSDKNEIPSLIETLPNESSQFETESVITSSEINTEPSKNDAEENTVPLQKDSPSEDKTIDQPETPTVKPIPKPKKDNSDYYTLG